MTGSMQRCAIRRTCLKIVIANNNNGYYWTDEVYLSLDLLVLAPDPITKMDLNDIAQRHRAVSYKYTRVMHKIVKIKWTYFLQH